MNDLITHADTTAEAPARPHDMDDDTAANLRAIVDAMVAHSVHTVRVAYSGGGDSGQTDEMSAFDATGTAMSMDDITDVASQAEFQDEPATLSLEEALEVALESLLDWSGNIGYHNNEGGYGCLTIAQDGTVLFDHSNYFTDVERDERTFTLGSHNQPGPSPI